MLPHLARAGASHNLLQSDAEAAHSHMSVFKPEGCVTNPPPPQKAADFARVGWSSKERATASQFHAAPHIWILGSLLSVFFWAVTFQLHIWSFYKGFRVSNPPPPQTTRSPCGGRTITDNFSLISYEGLHLIPFNPSAICSPVRCVRD